MADKHDVTEDSLYVVSRGPGRPPAEEPKAPLTTWLPQHQYDQLTRIAHKHDIKLSALVRDMIVLQLRRL